MESGLMFRYLDDIATYSGYIDFILSIINDDACKKLAKKFLKHRQGVTIRRKKCHSPTGLRLIAYILPSSLRVFTSLGIEIPLRVATNPAIMIRGNDLRIYARVGSVGGDFDHTFIVYADVPISEAEGLLKLSARTLLYPLLPYENVEDPRVSVSNTEELYHVRGFDSGKGAVITFKAILNQSLNRVVSLEPIRFRDREGNEFLLRDYRDTFPLNEKYIVVRPFFRTLHTGGIFIGPCDGAVVSFEELNPIPELLPQRDEHKTGGNAVLKISSNEFLLVYHSVDHHGVYYTYAATLSKDGELLSMTRDPIITPGPTDYIGRRPGTIFVCGLAKYGNEILIAAGKDDEAIVIYGIDENDMFEKLEYIKG
ncbi:hypothetical protein J4526_02880 [Desulfurococcaceae archaeon MEX13E-LK6-19]|nr:hypothetical protein J4526_02880 [Desulfurococcaceae archaeon MEX13E-LK6-19]